MQFLVTNPGGAQFEIDALEWSIKRYKQKNSLQPRELNLTIDREISVRQFATVLAVNSGKPVFRGYVENYQIQDDRKELTCFGMEKLLLNRFTPMYFYLAEEVTFSQLFVDTLSDGQPIGLLSMANGSVPPGLSCISVYDAASNIIKYEGCGYNSRWGRYPLFGCRLDAAKQLAEAPALADLAYMDYAYFRDATDLYIRIDGYYDRANAIVGGLICENAFDTTCRLGSLYNAPQLLAGSLQLNFDKIGDLIIDLARGHGFHVHIRDDWNYTYFDVDNVDGDDSGYIIEDSECSSIAKVALSDPMVHCKIGKGEGNQFYSIADMTVLGPFLFDVTDIENGYRDVKGNLVPLIDQAYVTNARDYQWKITTKRPLLMLPGDYLTLRPAYEKEEYLSAETIEENSDGETIIELGTKLPDITDAYEAIKAISGGYTDRYMWETHKSIVAPSATMYVSDPDHTAVAGVLAFTTAQNTKVPDKIKDEKLNPLVTLSLSIDLSSTASDLDLGRAALVVTVNSVAFDFGQIIGICLGDKSATALPILDITSVINANADNNIQVMVYMAQEISDDHSAYTGHPQIAISGTMNFYKRRAVI